MKAQIQTLANRFSRNVPATPSQLRPINMLLSTYCTDRDERLLVLGQIFDRDFTSSKQLSKGEASALIEMAFDIHGEGESAVWERNPEFCQFLEEVKVSLYAF